MKEEDITMIDNFRDLSIGQYYEILEISKDDSLEELDKQVKIISVLTGKTEDFILDLPINQFKDLSGKLGFLIKAMPDKVQRIASSYKIGKFELIPVQDIRKVTTAQYIDFISFHNAGMEDHLVEILSCLLVPKGEKYNQNYDIYEVQEELRKGLSVYDATCLYAFFLVSLTGSLKDTLTFSLKLARKIKDKEKREKTLKEIQEQISYLRRNGDGSQM